MNLKDRILDFLAHTTDQGERSLLKHAVSHLIMFSDYKEYRCLIKEASPSLYTLFYSEVRDLIRTSFDAKKVWRSLYLHSSSEASIEEAASRFEVDAESCSFVWDNLTASEKRSIEKKAQEEELGFLSDEDFSSIVKNLEKYCKKVAYLKLRFLSDNDRLFDLEDLSSELLARGIQVVRIYENCGEVAKIQNYAKRGISNHAVNLIQYYTSASRARVVNNTKGCGTCIFCLTDKPQSCRHSVADYRATTLSIQGLSTQEDSLPIQGLQATGDCLNDVSQDSFVSFMREGLSKPAARVMDLFVSADPGPEFEKFLFDNYSTTVDSLLSTPSKLVKLLCEFLDVPTSEAVNDLKARYALYKKVK